MDHSEQNALIPFDLPRQRIEDDSYIPSDEDIRYIHRDERLWAEPDLTLAAFDRWLAARDDRIRRETIREMEAIDEKLDDQLRTFDELTGNRP